MDNNDLSSMSGEQNFNQAPKLSLDMIGFDGKEGKFRLTKLNSPKEKVEGVEKHPVFDLGESIQVVFLKIRRQLKEKMTKTPAPGDPRLMSTNEHNTKGEEVLLYKDKGVEVWNSADVVSEYDMLRTNQIVYALWNGQLVRVNFKGSALGSESKAKEVNSFYSYIGSFDKNPNATDGVKDHFYEFQTNLIKVKEVGKLGSYFTIDFKRGEKLSQEDMVKVTEELKKVFAYTQASDAFYREKIKLMKAGKKVDAEQEKKFNAVAGSDDIEYPDEEIDPDNIPF